MSLEVDGVVIGMAVRGSGPVRDLIKALEPFRSGHTADHNYTVSLSDDRKVFQRLQWSGCTVVRTRDPDRFTRALALHLAGHGEPATGLIRTDGVVALQGDRATVLPASLRQSLPSFERGLRSAGIVLSDAPWVDVDPHTGEVAVAAPPPWTDRFAAVAAGLPVPPRPDPVVEPGRYPLTGWYFDLVGFEEEPMTLTDAVATVLSGLHWPLSDRDGPVAVTEMLRRTTFGSLALRTPRELADQIRT